MSLRSQLFHGDPKLEAAAVSDQAHILPGAVGQHVGKIQKALMELDGTAIDRGELQSSRYGPSTANAVLAYKKKRNIINRSYQTQADNIVGKMTIASLDAEMRAKDRVIRPEEIMGPPLIEPIPGFDAVAPDGFIIPIPRQIRHPNGTFLMLDQAAVSVFKSGGRYVMVIDNLGPPSHPNARAAASATAKGAAERATNQALRRAPDAARRVISFGAGRIAGGLVSIIASVLDPAPIAKEVIWSAVLDGRPVQYVVLTP